MPTDRLVWFDGFIGLGYSFLYVYPRVLLLFDDKKRLLKSWNDVIKWWPDDEIKVRFIEIDREECYYGFIMYCITRILQDTWVFFKLLSMSDHYKRLKEEYDEKIYIDLALYLQESNELNIFKYRKVVKDVIFLRNRDLHLYDNESVKNNDISIIAEALKRWTYTL
jgi:hypothetical protein